MNVRQNGPKIRITRSGTQRKRVCGITQFKKQATGHSPARKRWIPVAHAPASREGTCGSSSNPDFKTGLNLKERTSMKKHLSKKRVVLAAIVAVVLAISSGIAYAYWTSSASGSGSAATAAAAGSITVTATPSGTLVPSGSANLAFTASSTATTQVPINKIVLASVTSSNVACNSLLSAQTGQFTMADVNLTGAPVFIAAGATNVALNPAGVLHWVDATYNQDACQSAPLSLTFTVS